MKSTYNDVTIVPPEGFSMPFAVFLQDGSMSVLWASSELDHITWTDAFRELMPEAIRSKSSDGLPLIPALTDQNYFVATVYMCLLPEDLLNTDIDQLESHRSSAGQQ